MKVLFDQGVPAPLRHALGNHEVTTAHERGWSALRNGELLALAEAEFDAFITTDRNLRYQQNLAERRIAILVLPTTSWPRLRSMTADIDATIARLGPGNYLEMSLPATR